MHILNNPDGVVKYSIIHRLWLINSAELCNKKFQSMFSDHVIQLCLSLFNMHALAGGVDPHPVILEISSVSLNSEASRVSFLNQTHLQIEKYMKNGQPSFQCNV